MAGVRNTNGSQLWADNIASGDSELVARYRRAGFIIMGTTNSPELGKNASTEPAVHGPTHNPHRLGYSSGGSSGGTAAAIASGMVPIGDGSDGGGSIRIPASACGLVGLKPSRGRVTAAPGLSLLAYPLGVHHVLTRSVRDSARALDATAGPMPGDPYVIDRPGASWESALTADLPQLRIGLCWEDRYGEAIHPDAAAVVTATGSLLESLGHHVEPAAPAWPNDAFSFIMRTVAGVATKIQVDDRLAELGRELLDGDLEPFTRLLYDRAAAESGENVLRAMREIERACRELGAFFTDYDLLLTATLAEPVPPHGHLDTSDPKAMITRAGRFSVLTSPFNVTGQPAISLPLGTDSTGLPMGAQLVAGFGREDLLFSISAQIERATPWSIAPAITG